jgi:molybdate transport system ATP-binding protein
VYAFDGDAQTTAVGIKEKIALVSPELQARYLQQDWRLTGWQVVQSGFQGGDYVYQRPGAHLLTAAQSMVQMLGIEILVRRHVQELSTGELRKILIARALAGSPRILVCDEVCDGLDAAARAGLLDLLERVARHGTRLLYTTHRAEEMIPCITHRLMLERGRIVEQGAMSVAGGKVGKWESGKAPARFHPLSLSHFPTFPLSDPVCPLVEARPLIRIKRASVFLGSRRVLRDIDLEIHSGQHWAIVGPNGAGKSTLLKLMLGDLHPALGGCVQRFTFTSRNTIWDWKRTMGFVSPELQSNYRESLAGAEVVASGFFSSVGLRHRLSRRQKQRVAALMAALDLGALASRNILHMSYGEFRRILLARALVHDPALLICDEPFDGLDAASRARHARTLEQVARRGTSLVMVTHHPADLPGCVTHVGELSAGRLIFQGTARDYFARNGGARSSGSMRA